MTVIVTNHNEFEFSGRYNGVDYFFPIGKSVEIPLVAAGHIFGYGKVEQERLSALARNGWKKDGENGKEILANFVFGEDSVRNSEPVGKVQEEVKHSENKLEIPCFLEKPIMGKKAPLAHPVHSA